jgi:uncharacterized protein (DUF1330 family)
LSRGLGWFLAFVGLVTVLLVGAALLLGGNRLSFIFHEQRGAAPFVMVNLLDFEDQAAEQRYFDGYARETLQLIEALGGRQLWSARTDEVLAGNAADRWPLIGLVEYPSRASFIDMVTSSEYRDRLDARAAALARTAVYAGTSRFPFEPDADRSYVVRLTRVGEGVDYEAFENQWGQQEHELLARYGGALAWSADLNPLVAQPDDLFDRITLIEFPDAIRSSRWAVDSERETLASLERRLLERDVMLLMRTNTHAAEDDS